MMSETYARLLGDEQAQMIFTDPQPVALVADAILDCSNCNAVTLDPFGGAGTTLIAAEKTGRRASLIEIDPRYVDVTITRWQNLTRGTAVCAGVGTPYPDNGPRPGDAPLTIATERRPMMEPTHDNREPRRRLQGRL
jgi:DNA methylase